LKSAIWFRECRSPRRLADTRWPCKSRRLWGNPSAVSSPSWVARGRLEFESPPAHRPRRMERNLMTQPAKPAKPEPFEKNLERLDAIVQQLEDADLPLERALQLYEEGMRLSAVCHKQLQEAEGRVQILMKKAGGKIVAEPFEPEESEDS
jgi:exodeoxyribonuclease VII small subunit